MKKSVLIFSLLIISSNKLVADEYYSSPSGKDGFAEEDTMEYPTDKKPSLVENLINTIKQSQKINLEIKKQLETLKTQFPSLSKKQQCRECDELKKLFGAALNNCTITVENEMLDLTNIFNRCKELEKQQEQKE